MSSSPEHMSRPGDVAGLVARLRAGGGTAAICADCHAQLPSVSGVGLTAFDAAGRRFVLGTSGRLIDRIEDLQIRLDQGPCLTALAVQAPVLVECLADPEARRTWPRFTEEARRVGVAAVFAFPVLAGPDPVAVLNLCRDTPGPLPDDAYRSAVTFAAAAMTLLVDDLHLGGSAGTAVSIPAARAQQATGMVMGQATIGAVDALHRLRGDAFGRDVPLSDVVDEVLDGTLRYGPGLEA
ncbi:GAF domain-containing protein [Actinoplanes sp. NPDC051494]|uniref:GAF domain-containing protein n=1 Tax=Actinoplanes sp. NPDC051494 TaxID=3363907 RepID=UPI0037973AB0